MLYKYRTISEWTENIVKEKKIWLAKPNTLNDPFECNPTVYLAKDAEAYKSQIMMSQLSGFIFNGATAHRSGKSFLGLRGRELKLFLNRIKKQKNNLSRQYRIVKNFLNDVGGGALSDPTSDLNSQKELLENIGVFSLAEDPLNTLMWAHYGGNHTGLALGFESQITDNYLLKKIDYVDILPEVDLSSGFLKGINYFIQDGQLIPKPFIQLEDPQIQKIIYTKTTEWAYEKEWRLISNTYGKQSYPGTLKQIIFGMNCPKNEIEKYIQLCKEHHMGSVRFFRVVKCQQSKGKIVLGNL